ncbi:MAG: PQQ-like beta-propeller repeat protein, partial [Bacteroidales bacterium]|nr:PQQ-like beta-propeller repeat protein [Bacteroidales bacterium]
ILRVKFLNHIKMSVKSLNSLCIIALLTGSACNSVANNNQNSIDDDSSKTVMIDSSKIEVVSTPKFLPDTMFASANVLEFKVETKLESSGELNFVEDLYRNTPGIFTFRANLYRDADMGGKITGTPTTIEKVWSFTTDYDSQPTKYGTWGGGSGWTGQPIYVKWTDEQVEHFKQTSKGLTSEFSNEEIIFGSLCSKVYFLNPNTGKPSRTKLDAGNTIKGTGSIDPEYYNYYLGQGVPCRTPFGCMVYDLEKHERTFMYGQDPGAWRAWGAYDSSPVDVGGFLIWPGENGSVYKYVREQGNIKLHSVLRYKVKGRNAPGIESSICVYNNYGYFCDNHGNVICINLNTMKPVWRYDNHDDSDGTVVCRPENGTPYIYTASEVDKQGFSGTCYFVKLNGVDGSVVWETKIPCKRTGTSGHTLDGGMYCTPLVGKGNCDGMLFANICRNSAGKSNGEFTAISTEDGSIIYAKPLKQFAWSSPVAFYNENDEAFIFTGDASGNAYLFNGKTGEQIFTKVMANNFESSPVVIGNSAIVGSRINGIHKFVIK